MKFDKSKWKELDINDEIINYVESKMDLASATKRNYYNEFIMNFSDNISDFYHWMVQFGNAVPPFLGKAIGLAARYSNRDLK